MKDLRVVDRRHLMRAFHCTSYLYNPVDQVDTSIAARVPSNLHSTSLSAQPSFKISNSVLNLNSSTNTDNNKTGASLNHADIVNKIFTPSELLLQDFLFALTL